MAGRSTALCSCKGRDTAGTKAGVAAIVLVSHAAMAVGGGGQRATMVATETVSHSVWVKEPWGVDLLI